MAQIPVKVDENVFSPVKFRQEGHAWRMTGPYPVEKSAFFQWTWRDRAIGLIYSGSNFDATFELCRVISQRFTSTAAFSELQVCLHCHTYNTWLMARAGCIKWAVLCFEPYFLHVNGWKIFFLNNIWMSRISLMYQAYSSNFQSQTVLFCESWLRLGHLDACMWQSMCQSFQSLTCACTHFQNFQQNLSLMWCHANEFRAEN